MAVLTIGSFDGVHAGHRALVARARQLADARGEPVVAVTFSPRPEVVLAGGRAVLPDICSLAERERRLRAAGADEVVVLAFDRELMATPAREFVRRLRAEHGMTALCVGEEFRLGKGGEGDVAALRAMGVEVESVAVTRRPRLSAKISSTTVRRAIAAGIPAQLALDGLAPVMEVTA